MTCVTEHDVAVSPGRTHDEALQNGATPVAQRGPEVLACGGLGRITYCSGFNIRSNTACAPAHPGSVRIVIATPPATDPKWTDFAQRVDAAWTAFVQSGYNVALRGVNNHREYRAPQSVSRILQRSQGAVNISGGTYIISTSRTAGVSLHRSIPGAHQVGNIRSFIFHL